MTRALEWLAQQTLLRTLLLVSLLAGLMCGLDRLGLLTRLEWPLRDAGMTWLRQSPEEVANDVVVIAFDEDYLRNAREPLALFHGHLAATLETLATFQPAVIGLDFALPEKSFRFLAPRDTPDADYDRQLMIGLARTARTTPIILATTLDESARRYRGILPDYLAAAGLNPQLGELNLDPRGSAVICPDSDGLIRRYPDNDCRGGDGALQPLAAQMAAAQGLGRKDWRGDINFLAGPALPVLPVRELQRLAASPEGQATLRQMIQGRAVLLGAVLDYEDRHRIPVPLAADNLRSQDVPGILIQAQIYRSLMNQGLLQPRTLTSLWPLAWLAGLFWLGRRHLLKLGLLALACAGLALLSLQALQHGVTLPSTALMLTASLAWLGRWLLDLRQRQRQRGLIEQALGNDLPSMLSERLAEGDSMPLAEARETRVTLLALSLHGSLEAGGDPVRRLQALNSWRTEVNTRCMAHDGIAEPGDARRQIILFGYPLTCFAPERQALEAARELQEIWRSQHADSDLAGLRLQLLVHTGQGLAGCLQDGARAHFSIQGALRDELDALLARSTPSDHMLVCSTAVAEALGHPPVLQAGMAPDLLSWHEHGGQA